MVLDSLTVCVIIAQIQLTSVPGFNFHWLVFIITPIQLTGGPEFNSYLFYQRCNPADVFNSCFLHHYFIPADGDPGLYFYLFYHCSNPADRWSWIQFLMICFYCYSNPVYLFGRIKGRFLLKWRSHAATSGTLGTHVIAPPAGLNTPVYTVGKQGTIMVPT